MKVRDITPWRWGGLRRLQRDKEPVRAFRTQFEALTTQMERLFDEMLNEWWGADFLPKADMLPKFFGREFGREMLLPEIDEMEDERAFHVRVELPGMVEKDVELTLTDRKLMIRGEKKLDKEEEEKDFYRRERAYGAFRRVIELPGEVDAAKIEAKFKNGVLFIDLPKTEAAQKKVKHITVKAA